MHATLIRGCLTLALSVAAVGLHSAQAQDFLNREWLLDPVLSNVHMQTEKGKAILETHRFNAVEGSISKNADAKVRIELASIDTGTDLRDVRMRFLLFETFKFPYAEVSAKLDKAKLQALSTEKSVSYPLNLKVSMHGIVKEIETLVGVTRTSATTVSVATIQPIVVTAESFGFTNGIAKLSEAVGGTPIVPAASITFELVFATGSLKPEFASTPDDEKRAEFVRTIQQMLKRNRCYDGDITGRSNDAQKGVNKFVENANKRGKAKLGRIELAKATIGDFESWMKDADAIKDGLCPPPPKPDKPKPVAQPEKPKPRRQYTEPQPRASTPSYQQPSGSGGGGAIQGIR
jgi:hypothetical protein